jgi:hypothetical protein
MAVVVMMSYMTKPAVIYLSKSVPPYQHNSQPRLTPKKILMMISLPITHRNAVASCRVVVVAAVVMRSL